MGHTNQHMHTLSTAKATNTRGYPQTESLVRNLEAECSNYVCSYKHHSTHQKGITPYIRNTVCANRQIHQQNILYHVHRNHIPQIHNCRTKRSQTDSHTSDTNSVAEHTAETGFHWLTLSLAKWTSLW